MSSLYDSDPETHPSTARGLETSNPCVVRYVANAWKITRHVAVASL
jgi:hypothetical protein